MDLDKTLDRLFDQNQAKLPVEDRCATHGQMCLAQDDGYKCTKPKGHCGEHIAHGRLGYIGHRWVLSRG